MWKDDETLWRHAVESQPECSICLVNLGAALLRRDATGPAIASFERALALRPDHVKAHLNLGLAFSRLGDLDRAAAHLRADLARQPDNAQADRLLATVLDGQRCPHEALGRLDGIQRASPAMRFIPVRRAQCCDE